MRRASLLVALLTMLCTLWGHTAFCARSSVRLSTLDWPPYTGQNLPSAGGTADIVQTAMRQAGLELHLEFFPWKRAMAMLNRDNDLDGYFPEYPDTSREERFLYSDSIGTSPLVLLERIDRHHPWTNLGELSDIRIGVVAGYINSREFDSLWVEGALNVETSSNDITNLRKLSVGRVDAVVIDYHVFQYLLHQDAELEGLDSMLLPNPRLLAMHTLHVCFRNTDRGRSILLRFNQGLAKVDVARIQKAFLESIGVKSWH